MEALSERMAATKPRRRWFQFGLATLMWLVLTCAIGLAVFVTPAERQRRAVEYVQSLDGRVAYWPEEGVVASAPDWLRQWLGRDYFQSVKAVSLAGTPVNDAGLAILSALTKLEKLELDWTDVSDVGLAHLGTLTGLKVLTLEDTAVTDAGLAHLQGLTALELLCLRGTPISDAGLAHVKELTGLKVLHLDGTQVKGAGLAHLQGLTELNMLNLSSTAVGDAGLAHLVGLRGLEWLDLSFTEVSNAGVPYLKALTGLKELWLPIGLPRDVPGEPISAEAIREIQRALPNCELRDYGF